MMVILFTIYIHVVVLSIMEKKNKLELWVTSLSDTPRLQYYDVQTLEF